MSELDEMIENKVEEIETKKQQETQVISEEQNNVPVVNNNPVSLEDLQDKYLKEQVEQGKNVAEIASDFAKAKVTSEIIANEDGKHDKLHDDLAKEQEKALKASFVKDTAKAQTETLIEKQKKAEAFYISFRPILEFDFSNLVNTSKKNEKGEKVENAPKTYAERSYGIPLMVLMLFLFTIPYCIISLLLAVFNGVNAIFVAISTFSKTARVIVLSILIIAFALLLIYCAILGIDYIFGTNILSQL